MLGRVLAAMACGAWTMAAAQGNSVASSGAAAPRILMTQAVDESRRTVLRGNTHPLARAEFDRGVAPASLPVRRMILVLKRSAEQEAALRVLLDGQQTKGTPTYHQWLTPEQFGEQFGPADSDVEAVTVWLASHGFQITGVSKGRTTIEFSGSAAQVQDAFHTAIHSYEVKGEQHWANSSDPSIPSALAPVVRGVLSLHNFPRHPQHTMRGTRVPATSAGAGAPSPMFTFTSGKTTFYGLGPTDFATIYNVLPLWNAGVDGTGQTIAIVGETNIHVSDIEAFRSLFGLPAKDPQIILNGPDPGVVGDEPEAVLDVSWSGAVARNATIDLVVSATTEVSLGVDLSALYIVDNDVAPVMSESYGECEATLGTGNDFYSTLWQQAAAEGITVVIAAGDSGSAGCDDFDTEAVASDGLAVSGFASTPYNVAVGGTDFDQTVATAPNYWSATNNPTTESSALGYIPETTWNQSCAGQGAGQCTADSDYIDIVAGSGGASSNATSDSQVNPSGYPKPSWQTGTGVPQDGVRDIPDVSLFASAGMNGSFYIMCEADVNLFGIIQSGYDQVCSLSNETFLGIGGTSASAPAFAGIMALVNQKTDARQGNANYVLYNLAAQSGASCNSTTAAATGSSCIFYDITKGNNSVPCTGTLNCGTAPTGGYGVMVDANGNPAWTTTTGYDLATGLGTVNAANLVKAWNSATFTPSTTTLTHVSPVNLVHGQPVSVSVTVTAESGGGTPTGSVALMTAPSGNSMGLTDFLLVDGAATGTTALLPAGTYNLTAHYPGDGSFAASDSAPVQVTVGKENSQTKASLEAFDSQTNGTFAPVSTFPYGSILSLSGTIMGAAGTACAPNPVQSGAACPTGSINFTLNGKALDAGTYPLNNLAYTQDSLPGADFTALGSFTLQAQYSGDASYNSSSATLNETVTQASTSIGVRSGDLNEVFTPEEPVSYFAYSGELFHISAGAIAASILQAPTGTISIFENGSPVSGTETITSTNGSYNGIIALNAFTYASLGASVPVTIDASGTYSFSSSYSGDAYYTGSQSSTPFTMTVEDTTFNITPPIPSVTIAAPGQSGTAAVTLTNVDNFPGQVTVTCTLPATMTEATCPLVTVNLAGQPTATAQLTITTTAAHSLVATRTESKTLYGLDVLACAVLFILPGARRRRIFAVVLVLVGVAGLGGCGGGGSGGSSNTDPGTPAGTYTVNVTANAINITRTASFTVTIQ